MFGSSAVKVPALLLEFTECKQIANSECKRKNCEFIRREQAERWRVQAERWREQAEKGAGVRSERCVKN
jgi:hypothetical protein